VEHIRRCLALKSEAFCLQVDRLENPDAPTELAQGLLIKRANELGTRLWIFDVAPAFCSYPEQLVDLSTLFAICADSSRILADLLRNDQGCEQDDILKECIELIAEVQSMLKTALERVTFAHPDPDQRRLFSVILDLTDQKHIYIDRYMKTDDPAEPSQWPGFQVRLNAFAKRIMARRAKRQHALLQERTIKRVQGQIEYHRKLLEKGSHDIERDWQRIADALTQWSESGLKTDDQRLRTTLTPVGLLLPGVKENEAQKFIRAYLQSWELEDEEDEDIAQDHTEELDNPEISQVANWLRGQTIVLIGGDERPHAKAALINAFALKDVIWVSTRPHETLEILKTPIRRDEVCLVVLTIRWASHAYGNIRTLCRQLGKPFIRLPAGYNPHRVAYEVIDQASEYFIEVTS
jgi:hypothetical protein